MMDNHNLSIINTKNKLEYLELEIIERKEGRYIEVKNRKEVEFNVMAV